MPSRVPLLLSVLASAALLMPAPAAACVNGNPQKLETIVRAVDEIRQTNGPRYAIKNCYTHYLSEPVFKQGPPPQQSQFLFDYLDAAVGLKEWGAAIEVARIYIGWLHGLPNAADFRRSSTQQPAKVLFWYIDFLQTHDRNFEALTQLEALREDLAFFNPEVLNQWERSLSLALGVGTGRAEMAKAIRQNVEVAARWRAYRDVLLTFRRSDRLGAEAEMRLIALKDLRL